MLITVFEIGTDGPDIIVVGVDGSPTSLRAGAYAAGLARRQNSRVVVVYAVAPPAIAGMAPSASGSIEQSMIEAADELGEQVRAGAAHTGLAVEYRAVRGDPYTVITRTADELRADAVVVGASTRAGHRLVGSLAVRLVRAGRWPVTVVP
jgi:nucleotide-binding universal stress UspA family protein